MVVGNPRKTGITIFFMKLLRSIAGSERKMGIILLNRRIAHQVDDWGDHKLSFLRGSTEFFGHILLSLKVVSQY